MAYIKEYWNDKEGRAKLAQTHTEQMAALFKEPIADSIKATKIYSNQVIVSPETNLCYKTQLIVEDIDSVSAVLKYGDTYPRTAVLNFASHKNPGGMFMNGSKAQEECLCHESFLYNVISVQKQYYEENNKTKNRSLYINRALYSPGVYFERDDYRVEADVITCAAPNFSAAEKYCNVTKQENSKVLFERIAFVLGIAKKEQVDVLILGAYGCGVFGQDPYEVAKIFKFLLTSEKSPFLNVFPKVVFAIPKGSNQNLDAFQKIFS